MSGHSKWANIKHKKGIADAKKGVVFTKIARELTVAARQGSSGDPAENPKLRLAMDKARQANMPSDNMDRAIKKGLGTGEDDTNLEETLYEGYSPGGAAILLHALTDNRNRTAAEVRSTFTRGGGNLGEVGSVAWVFENKTQVVVEGIEPGKAEDLALAAIDAGADDFKIEDGILELIGPPGAFDAIKIILDKSGVIPVSSIVTMVPKTMVPLSTNDASQTFRLLIKLEDLDDVSQVFTNADFPDEILEDLTSE